EGSSLSYTHGKAQQITKILGAMDEVAYTYATVGAGAAGTVTDGEFYVKLTPVAERSRSQSEMMVYTREQLKPLVGVRTSVLVADNLGGAQAPLAVEVRGVDV